MPSPLRIKTPTNIEAVYHAKELVKYTIQATKDPNVFPTGNVIQIILSVQSDALRAYQLVSKASSDSNSLQSKYYKLTEALDCLSSVKATVELICDLNISIVKNPRHWAELIEAAYRTTNKWRSAIIKQMDGTDGALRDVNGFYRMSPKKKKLQTKL